MQSSRCSQLTDGGIRIVRPVRKGVEIKQRHCVTIDGDAESEDAEDVHDEPGLHHVDGRHRAVTEHDGVGSSGHGKSKCIGTYNAWV